MASKKTSSRVRVLGTLGLLTISRAAYAQTPSSAPAPDSAARPPGPAAAPAAPASSVDPTPSSPPPAAPPEPGATATPSSSAPPAPSTPVAAPPPANVAAPSPEASADATVEVRGQKLEEAIPKQLAAYGTRIETIRAEQIQNAGRPDVATSLEILAPGLYMSPKNGPFDYVDISFQGSRTEDVLWLLDGVRLNNRLYGGTTPLDTLPASIVDRVEIMEGPEALFYGTQGVAGAINVLTKPFSDQTDGQVTLGADTLGGRHIDSYVRTAFGQHKFVFYGSGDDSTGYQAFRAQDYQPSGTDRDRRYQVLTLGAKYAFDIRDDLRLSLLYQHTDARLDFAQPFLVAAAYNDRDEHVATAKLEYTPSSALQVLAKGYAHIWNSHYTEYDNVVGTPGSLSVVEDDGYWGFHDFGANVVARVAPTPWLDAFVGYDLQSYEGRDAVLVITQKSESVNAFFAQIRTPESIRNLRLAAGVRYNAPTVAQSATVWTGSGQYDFGPALFVRGMVGTAFRLPTDEELFANDPKDELGNPNLQPESSFNVNASVGGRFGYLGLLKLTWEAIGFFRNVTNLIEASGFDQATDQSVFENVPGTVEVRGATGVLQGALADSWSASASYTYSSATEAGQQIDKVPQHQAKGWVDWHPATIPVGAAVYLDYVGNFYQTFGPTDREEVSGHFLLDVSGRVFLDGERRHRVSLALTNVLGSVYAASYGKGVRDADGSDYTYWNLGQPRTLAFRYQYRF